eukprot:Em0018g582a
MALNLSICVWDVSYPGVWQYPGVMSLSFLRTNNVQGLYEFLEKRDAEIFVTRALKIYETEQHTELFLFTLKRTSLLLMSDPSMHMLSVEDLTTHMKSMDPLRLTVLKTVISYGPCLDPILLIQVLDYHFGTSCGFCIMGHSISCQGDSPGHTQSIQLC